MNTFQATSFACNTFAPRTFRGGVPAVLPTANKGLVLFDFEQHFILGDLTLEVIAYPDWMFATPPAEKVDYLTGRVVLLEVTGSEPPTIAGSSINPVEVLDALTGVSVYPDQGSPTGPVGGLLGGSGQDPEITGSV